MSASVCCFNDRHNSCEKQQCRLLNLVLEVIYMFSEYPRIKCILLSSRSIPMWRTPHSVCPSVRDMDMELPFSAHPIHPWETFLKAILWTQQWLQTWAVETGNLLYKWQKDQESSAPSKEKKYISDELFFIGGSELLIYERRKNCLQTKC